MVVQSGLGHENKASLRCSGKNPFTIGIRVYKNDGQARMNKGQESRWGSSGKL